MPEVICVGGRFCEPRAPASISVLDRGYLFGDSIFETLRAYRGKPFRLSQHLRIFERAARALYMPPVSTPELAALVTECLARSALADAYIRLTMSRGEGGIGLGTDGCNEPVISVIVRPLHPYPADAYIHGIESTILSTPKIPAACLDPTIKTGNYLNQVMARRQLAPRGMLEGVQLAYEGHVASGTVSNVFLVSGDVLYTPAIESGCRPGVTRAAVLELASAAGLVSQERLITVDELLSADEIFFTNTLMEILPVATIDGTRPRGGERVRALRDAYTRLVARDETEDKHIE